MSDSFVTPMACGPPGSSVHGIAQARILEWVAISFSGVSSQPRDWTRISCIGRRILYHRATRMPDQIITQILTDKVSAMKKHP